MGIHSQAGNGSRERGGLTSRLQGLFHGVLVGENPLENRLQGEAFYRELVVGDHDGDGHHLVAHSYLTLIGALDIIVNLRRCILVDLNGIIIGTSPQREECQKHKCIPKISHLFFFDLNMQIYNKKMNYGLGITIKIPALIRECGDEIQIRISISEEISER